MAHVQSPPAPWSVAGLFLVGYGVLRFTVEFFREPDAHVGFQAFGWLTQQLLCVPMFLLGAWLLFYAYRVQRRCYGREKYDACLPDR